jgi:hypothetical protein
VLPLVGCSGVWRRGGLAVRAGVIILVVPDILARGRTNMWPRCRQDLTEAVRAHLFRCAMLPYEIRFRAQAITNAPNPAGRAILGCYFAGGISPLGLVAGAALPTLVLGACFFFF